MKQYTTSNEATKLNPKNNPRRLPKEAGKKVEYIINMKNFDPAHLYTSLTAEKTIKWNKKKRRRGQSPFPVKKKNKNQREKKRVNGQKRGF